MFKILKYSQLLLENVQRAKQILTELDVPFDNPNYLEIRKMLSGNDGYTYWFVKQHFKNNVSLADLKTIWDTIKSNKAIISKFETPVVDLETVENFWDQYYILKNLSKARSAYNKFLPEQKKLIDFETDKDLLEALAAREDADVYFYNISKRHHTRNELIVAIERFLSGEKSSDFFDLLSKLKADSQTIAHASEENDIIITVVDYPSLRKWGADTSWCIVDSESTFKSYTSKPLSQQFIIFLTDEFGILSKIGVTTNIGGYYTAHAKNDSRISKDTLIEILNERGLQIDILLPSKEGLLERDNWNAISVEVLKQIGFTNEEILKKKNQFTSAIELKDFNLDFGKIKSLISKTQLAYDESEKGKINHLITACRNRSSFISVLKKAVFSYSSRYNNVMTMTYVKDGRHTWEPADVTGLIELIKPTEEELSNDILISWFPGEKTPDMIMERVRFFKKIGRELTDDQFEMLALNRRTRSDMNSDRRQRSGNLRRGSIEFFSQLLDLKVYPDLCLSLLKKFVDNAESGDFELDVTTLEGLKNKLQDKKLFDKILEKSKAYYLRNPYSLRVRSSGRGIYTAETWTKINYFDLPLTIRDFEQIFMNSGIENLKEILDYLRKKGQDLTDMSNIERLAGMLYEGREGTLTIYSEFIKCGVFVDESYDKIIEWVKSQTSPLTYDQKTKLEELFNKQDIYSKKWQDLQNIDRINEGLKYLLETANYFRNKTSRPNYTPEAWFDNYWDILKDYSWGTFKDYGGENYFVALVLVLIRARKLQELNDLENTTVSKRFENFCRILLDKYIANGVRIFEKLSEEENNILYNWLRKRYEFIEKNDEVISLMNACHYLYDKEKFWKIVDQELASRNNYQEKDWRTGAVKNRTTLRVLHLAGAISFLVSESYWDDVEKILQKFSNLKMSKKEYQKTIEMLNYPRPSFQYRSEEDRKEGKLGTFSDRISSKKLQELLNKYIKPPESSGTKKILDWYQFINF